MVRIKLKSFLLGRRRRRKNGYVKNLRLFGLYANGIFWGFFEVSISHKNQASSSSGEFFCTIWLIRQLTNEGWFVSLLPENVSIFRPSFFSISSPSRMSLTSRPNICYYYLGVYVSWTMRGQAIWEVENSVKNYKGMYYLQFILWIDLKAKSGGITCITLSTMLWGDFSNAILKKPSESV